MCLLLDFEQKLITTSSIGLTVRVWV